MRDRCVPSGKLGIWGLIGAFAAGVAAISCFVAAAALSPGAAVPVSPAPGPIEVRLGRDGAFDLLMVLAADGTPRAVAFTHAQLEAMAALANHGLGWVRFRPSIDDDTLRLGASMRLAKRSWLNIELLAVTDPTRGWPRIELRAGHVRIPDRLVQAGIKAIEVLARRRGIALPPPDALVREFAVSDDAVRATLAVPRDTLGIARRLLGSAQVDIDRALLGQIYGRLLADEVERPGATFADRVRLAFMSPSGDPAAYNRAAFVALAMATVGPKVGRLAGLDASSAPCPIAPPKLLLAGRDDLPKHFALSAALAATTDSRFTRAIGEWKELDDSLPGGSGFSFIDLIADRAAMHLGRAAISDSAVAARVADRLAAVEDKTLLPPVTGFVEGLSDTAFARQYGTLDAGRYRAAIRRIDARLGTMSLYRDLLPPA